MSLMPLSSTPASATLPKAPETVLLRPQRSIGNVAMDVTVEEDHKDELEITEHPVEHGAPISDHAYLKPAQLTIKAGVSDASGKATSGDRRTVAAYEALRKLQASREPFDVVTGKRVYKNMQIKSLGVITDKDTEHVLMVTAELQEILIAYVRTVSVPRNRQRLAAKTAAPVDKGQVQAEPDKSAALKLIGGKGYRRAS